jgi:hypothetical protein
VLGFFIVGTVMNSITSSKWERRIWAPVNAIMLICTLIIALN